MIASNLSRAEQLTDQQTSKPNNEPNNQKLISEPTNRPTAVQIYLTTPNKATKYVSQYFSQQGIRSTCQQAKQRKVVKKRVKSETQDLRASERNKPLKQRQAI